jgi:FKBP-type peptidyl-prolyl cis-trans isomerase FkpA
MFARNFVVFPFLFALFFISCREEKKQPKKQLTKEEVDYLSKEMGKWNATKETDDINQYIKRHNYTMEETNSGLRYMYITKGKGTVNPKLEDKVRVNYKIYLLDGKLCYTSDADGAEFVVAKDNIESGLHEGIQLMHEGDKMRFILPSFLAHGLTGDQDKIPSLTPVVYEVELIEILNKRPQVIK